MPKKSQINEYSDPCLDVLLIELGLQQSYQSCKWNQLYVNLGITICSW